MAFFAYLCYIITVMLKQKLEIKLSKHIVPAALIIGVLVVVSFILFNRAENSSVVQPSEILDNESQTTSDQPTAQSDFSDGDDSRYPAKSTSGNGSATVQDNGDFSTSTNPSVSDDGKTTVYVPENGSVIASGSSISGITDNDNVYFRLIDDKIGLIGEGQLPINDGKFSGTLNIESQGSEGRLDIFSRKPDGVEFSNVSLDVRFE